MITIDRPFSPQYRTKSFKNSTCNENHFSSNPFKLCICMENWAIRRLHGCVSRLQASKEMLKNSPVDVLVSIDGKLIRY